MANLLATKMEAQCFKCKKPYDFVFSHDEIDAVFRFECLSCECVMRIEKIGNSISVQEFKNG